MINNCSFTKRLFIDISNSTLISATSVFQCTFIVDIKSKLIKLEVKMKEVKIEVVNTAVYKVFKKAKVGELFMKG